MEQCRPFSMGIDLALGHSGVVVVQAEKKLVYQEVIKPKATGIERLYIIKSAILNIMEKFRPNIVVLEGYAFNKPFRAHQMGEIGGIIRLLSYVSCIPLLVIPPKKAKVFACGSGKAGKEEVIKGVYQNWGIEFSESDLADAYVLALMGLYYLQPETRIELDRVRRNIIDGLSLENGFEGGKA